MIVVNYFQESDFNPETDGYSLELAAVINDVFDINEDPQRIKECIEDCPEWPAFENEVMYEIYLDRGLITQQAPFMGEKIFVVSKVVKLDYDPDNGHYKKPITF